MGCLRQAAMTRWVMGGGILFEVGWGRHGPLLAAPVRPYLRPAAATRVAAIAIIAMP